MKRDRTGNNQKGLYPIHLMCVFCLCALYRLRLYSLRFRRTVFRFRV